MANNIRHEDTATQTKAGTAVKLLKEVGDEKWKAMVSLVELECNQVTFYTKLLYQATKQCKPTNLTLNRRGIVTHACNSFSNLPVTLC